MLGKRRDTFRLQPGYQPLMRMLGIDAREIFRHPDIKVWRKLPDRENCTLDCEFEGRPLRLHIKRYRAPRWWNSPADDEVAGIMALNAADIPTVPLVGWGSLANRKSFVITANLGEYTDAEKLVQGGLAFKSLLNPTADLAAKLHKSNLHHRDLYLCHFFAKANNPTDLRLIDVARVASMKPFTRHRWIIKDLAQFWYSTTSLPVTDEQRERWLKRYVESRGIAFSDTLRNAIINKSNWIARHDAKLRKSQPTRNISLPSPQGGSA